MIKKVCLILILMLVPMFVLVGCGNGSYDYGGTNSNGTNGGSYNGSGNGSSGSGLYKNGSGHVEWGYSECGRFALSISVERTIFQHGDDIYIEIAFKNLSGEYVMLTHTMDGIFYLLRNGEIFREWADGTILWVSTKIAALSEETWRYRFWESGTYQLTYVACFVLNFGTPNHEEISFESNTLEIEILE